MKTVVASMENDQILIKYSSEMEAPPNKDSERRLYIATRCPFVPAISIKHVH